MTLDQQTTRGPMLTQAAADKAIQFIDAEGASGLMLRVTAAGGCGGPRYQLGLDDRVLDGDIREHWLGVDVVVDSMSAAQLAGATIDWVELPGEQGFSIDNPNAVGDGCGCGCGCDGEC